MNTTFKVNRNAWHFRWLTFEYAMRNYDQYYKKMARVTPAEYFDSETFLPNNFCEYWRKVLLWPFLRTLFLIALIGYNVLMLSVLGVGDTIITVGGVLGLIAAVFVLVAIFIKIKHWIHARNAVKGHKPDGFMKTIYSSYKNKFCPTVEYTKEQ